MSQAKVFALPLMHSDLDEYLRIRRGIEIAGVVPVAFELPKTPLTENLFKDVLGRSGRNLDTEIAKVLTLLGVDESFTDTVISDLIELDNAKHTGKINSIYPIDMDVNDQRFVSNAKKRTGRFDQLMALLENGNPLLEIASIMRDILILNNELYSLRESIIKDNVESILNSAPGGRSLLLMTGAVHVPPIEKGLDSDGISVVEIDVPKKVTGIWWLAYTAALEVKQSGYEKEAPFGRNLIRYSLLHAVNAVKLAVGLKGFSEEEVRSIKSIESLEDAERLYQKLRTEYAGQFVIPILPQLRG